MAKGILVTGGSGLVGAYAVLPLAIAISGGPWWAMLGFLSLPLAQLAAGPVLSRTDGPSLNEALARTGALLAAFALAVSGSLLIW